ncbi:MAG: A/G-specific adenine glycosylase [Amphiplicatus sp.]
MSARRRIANPLLSWYARRKRDLPWRTPRPDPYRVWLSEIMLQQTTVAAATPRYRDFLARWPSVAALAAAPLEDVLAAWAGLGYYARARNLHKCARVIVSRCGGVFPSTEEELRALPGVGAYTAAAIAAIAFDRRAVVVDGNVERVTARLFAVEAALPAAKREIYEKAASIWPASRSGDFAQALMDLGAGVCTPRAPACGACPIAASCAARKAGAAELYPRRAPRKPKPTRYGAGFALFDNEGRVLVERRPEKGLLGAMLGLPTTAWTQESGDHLKAAPADADWRHAGLARHSFTHFHLELDVYVGETRRRRAGDWADAETVRLPTVMRKALDLALALRNGLV